MSDMRFLDKKINELKVKIQRASNILEKVAFEIDFYNYLKEKSKLQNDIQQAIKYKKLKLQKELEYISLIEEQREIKTISLREFLGKEFKEYEYVKTYIKAIDENIGGLPIGVFIQFGAKSYTGKTTTLMRIALNIAKSEKIVHFNFEMSDRVLHKIYKEMIKSFVEPIQLENLILPEEASSELDELIKDIKLLYYRDKIRIFIIDSNMKIKTDEKSEIEATAKISKSLSELSRELGITIILINQLSKEAITNNEFSLKGSINQEYDADIIFGLGYKYKIDERGKIIRDEFGHPVVREDMRILHCKKNRLGKPFSAEIHINEIFPPEVKEITPQIEIPDI